MPPLILTPKLSFEPRFRMFIITVSFTKANDLVHGLVVLTYFHFAFSLFLIFIFILADDEY